MLGDSRGMLTRKVSVVVRTVATTSMTAWSDSKFVAACSDLLARK
jgi:hypothetical protein